MTNVHTQKDFIGQIQDLISAFIWLGPTNEVKSTVIAQYAQNFGLHPTLCHN